MAAQEPTAHVAFTAQGEIAYIVAGDCCVPGSRIAFIERDPAGVLVYLIPPFPVTPKGATPEDTYAVRIVGVADALWEQL